MDSAAEVETGGLSLNRHHTHPHCREQTETIKWQSSQVRKQNRRLNRPIIHEAKMFQIIGYEISLSRGSNKNGPP